MSRIGVVYGSICRIAIREEYLLELAAVTNIISDNKIDNLFEL